MSGVVDVPARPQSEAVTGDPAERGEDAPVVLRFAAEGWRRFRRLLLDPQLRALRWVLLAGLVVRLVLAPLTSWAIDTPGFILGDLGLVFTGTPYSSDFYFNPPLGAFAEAPFVGLAALISGANSLVPLVPAVSPAASATGMVSALIPVPLALLAEKLPLIVADLVAGLILYALVQRASGRRSAILAAAAWLLNPLVIWSSSVHGEVDGLAAMFVLAFVFALVQDWPFVAGLSLSLAIFTKAYPVVLIPVAVAYFVARRSAQGPAPRSGRSGRIGGLAAGLALGALPFLTFLPSLTSTLTSSARTSYYGGLSVLMLFNAAVPKFPGALGSWQVHSVGAEVLLGLRVLTVVAAVGATFAMYRWIARTPGDAPPPLSRVVLPLLWAAVGIVLADPVVNSENVVGVLALIVLARPALGRFGVPAVVGITVSGFAMYLALLTPAAYFYPLAVQLGTPAVRGINAAVFAYAHSHGLFSQGTAWLLSGLSGGILLLLTWVESARRLWTPRYLPTGEVR